jgi:biopolymer transport protein ExbB
MDRTGRTARLVKTAPLFFVSAICVAVAVAPWASAPALAQEGPQPGKVDAKKRAAEDLAAPSTPPKTGPTNPATAPVQPGINGSKGFNMLDLYFQGGPLMYPITFFSLVVLIFGFERLMAIRRGKIIPQDLVHTLGQIFNVNEQLTEDDLKTAYRVCNSYPSAASKVIKVALLKAGRPHAELEQAVKEASEREATRLYGNVRPLNLSASVAPLLGLLGTVQGMIMCFYQTASGDVHGNRAAVLANGIYIALVTTFAGLVVAIPATILAHWFEGRIQKMFHEIDELLLGVLPALEQFEHKVEIRRRGANSTTPPVAAGKNSRDSSPPPTANVARRPEREEQRGI